MKGILLLITLLSITSIGSYAQERYGHTFNASIGVGYYGYVGHPVAVAHINYEFDVVKNLTLAPFISMYGHSNDYYYGSPNNGYRYYTYREVVIPIGVKSTYYFDDLLNASDRWDFYAGGSLGASLVISQWDSGYTGNRNVYNAPPAVFVAAHIGAEYHFTSRIGGFLDLSTAVSTVGIAVHK